MGLVDNYAPANTPAGTLPDIAASLAGQDLLKAIWHERRVESAEEALRFWDLIRTGRYFGVLPAHVASRAVAHGIATGVVHLIPLLPVDLSDAQVWKLPRTPGTTNRPAHQRSPPNQPSRRASLVRNQRRAALRYK